MIHCETELIILPPLNLVTAFILMSTKDISPEELAMDAEMCVVVGSLKYMRCNYHCQKQTELYLYGSLSLSAEVEKIGQLHL